MSDITSTICAEEMAANLIKEQILMLHNVINDYKKENNLLTEQVLERDTHIDILDEKIKNQDEEIKNQDEEIEKMHLFHEWNKSATLKWNEEVEVNRRLKEEIEEHKKKIKDLEDSHSEDEDDDDDEDRDCKCNRCGKSFITSATELKCSGGECFDCQRYA